MSNPTPLSNKGLRRLQDIWLEFWKAGRRFPGGNAEQWYVTVSAFQAERGDEVVPHALRELEERTINSGRAQEYLAALREVVQRPNDHDEYAHAILIITATVEERAEALNRIRLKQEQETKRKEAASGTKVQR